MKRAAPTLITPRRGGGFTLAELLIVIGIIAVLVAILIPVVSKVRLAAKTTETQALLQKINNAITNYFNDFHAYPGMHTNANFNPATPGKPPRVADRLTQSEDLVLSLLGALKFTTTPPVSFPNHVEFSLPELGKGPLTLNPRQLGRKNAYMTLKDSEVTPPPMIPPGTADQRVLAHTDSQPWMAEVGKLDSVVPEFMDQYNNPRPIIYVRCNPAVPKRPGNAHILGAKGSFNVNNAYNWDSFGVYIRDEGDAKATARTADFYYPPPGGSASSTWTRDPARVQAYFTGPAADTPRNDGGYMLFSAGPDGRFGSEDDLIFGSGGGQ
jgi:prepilin-type N-terminal cleavage/methylation domain-containing protein